MKYIFLDTEEEDANSQEIMVLEYAIEEVKV